MNNKRFLKLFYIVLGFCVGQGAMFFSQTYVAYKDGLEIVGSVGIGLGFLSFYYWLADMGGTFLTSRFLNKSIVLASAFFISRIVFSIILIIINILVSEFYIPSDTIDGILSVAFYVIVLGSLNFTGVSDFYNKNKWISPFSGLSWFFSSIALALFFNKSESYDLGLIIGSGYVLGLFFFTVVKVVIVKSEIVCVLKVIYRVNLEDIIVTFKEGILYNVSLFSNQIYGRLVPVLIEKHIGLDMVGIFVYARNVVNMFGQVMMFSRRVEFDMLISFDLKSHSILRLLSKQKISLTICCLCFFSSLLSQLIILNFDFSSKTISIANAYFFLSVILLMFNFSSLYSQLFISKGFSFSNGLIQSFTATVFFIMLVYSIESYGMYSVYILDFLLHLSRFFIFMIVVNNFKRILQ